MWQNARNNNLTLASFDYQAGEHRRLSGAGCQSLLPRYAQQQVVSDFPALTMLRQEWKTGYAMTQFAGIERTLAENWSLETAALASAGCLLIATDQINRPFSVPREAAGADNFSRSYNPSLPEIAYRGSQGSSHYAALTATVRHRSSRRRSISLTPGAT